MQKKLALLTFAVALGLLLFSACYQDKLPTPVACEKPVYYTTNLPVDSASQIRYLINRTCAHSGCHDGSNMFNLGSYADLSPYITSGSFQSRVITLREDPVVGMPRNGGAAQHDDLTIAELDTVQCWINGGYLETN